MVSLLIEESLPHLQTFDLETSRFPVKNKLNFILRKFGQYVLIALINTYFSLLQILKAKVNTIHVSVTVAKNPFKI